METRYEILELARFLTELSVIDYYFVVHRSSDVALAALLNSMEAVPGSTKMTMTAFEQELSRVVGGLDPHKKEVLDCRDRLQVLYTQGGYSRPEITGRETRDETVSPVCVSFGLDQHQQEYTRPALPTGVQEDAMAMDRIQENYEIIDVNDIHDLTKNESPVSKQPHCEHANELHFDHMLFGDEDDF
jgi:hypothetical protein